MLPASASAANGYSDAQYDPSDEGDDDASRHPEMPGQRQETGRAVRITAPTLAVRGLHGPGTRSTRTYSGRRQPAIPPRTAYALVSGVRLSLERRAVKPSAQPTLVRTQHLPPLAITACWLRKRGPRPRFLVTACIRVCHRGSMRGSGYGHIADSVRAERAVRITARFGQLPAAGLILTPWSRRVACRSRAASAAGR
jgi:hypothetical protein